MPAPDIIEPIMQKDGGDCAIAALAMLLQKPYVDVSKQAMKMFDQPHARGLWVKEIISLAKHFGRKLVRKKPNDIDLDNDTGMLLVKRQAGDHAAVLFNGSVYDPSDGLFYTSDVYLINNKLLGLLVP